MKQSPQLSLSWSVAIRPWYLRSIHSWVSIGMSIWLHTTHAQDIQEKYAPFGGTKTVSDLPAHTTVAEADTLIGSPNNMLQLRGKAHIKRDAISVHAPEIDVNLKQDEVSAQGGVVVQQGKDTLRANEFKINLRTEAGYATLPEYFFAQGNGRANATSLTLTEQRSRILQQASYTSCKPGQDDWLLKADTLILDEATQTGTAKGASLRFMNVPIFAAPHFEFPLGKERRSGVLPPSAGYNSVSGFEVAVPYYFNLAHNYDATLTTRWMTRRGLHLTGESRYLTNTLQGDAQLDWLPRDSLRTTQRWGLFSHHNYHQGALSAGINFERVSDNTFFADLSRAADSATRTNLPTELWARYQTNWGEINTRASHYQTLQDVTNSIVPTYERLPVVNIQLTPVVWQNLGGLTFNFNAQAARYQHPTLTQGSRVYAVPQFSHAWLPSWGFIKSKVQLNMAHYAGLNGISYTNTPSFSRVIPVASLDTGLLFERTTAWFGKTATQTLEPRLYFVYAPFKDQSNVPVFDSALSSFSLAQIFSDNIFTGQDRIANAKHITPALTTQWLDPNTGTTLFKATVGKRYYFEPQRVTLTGASLPDDAGGGNTVASSDWLIAAVGQPLTSLYIDAALQYDQTNREVVNSTYSVLYRPASRKILSLSRRFTKDVQDAVDIAWQWRMAANHAVLGKLAYSLGVPNINLNRGLTESLLGYEYDAGCWVFRIAMNRYVNTANVKATSFYFQLDLSGLTQVSSGSLDTLKKNIPGYTPFEGTPTWTYDAFRSF